MLAKRLAGGSDSEKMSRRPFSISSTVQTLRATQSNRNDREKRRNSEARVSFKTTCGGVYYAQTGRPGWTRLEPDSRQPSAAIGTEYKGSNGLQTFGGESMAQRGWGQVELQGCGEGWEVGRRNADGERTAPAAPPLALPRPPTSRFTNSEPANATVHDTRDEILWDSRYL